MQIRPRMVKEWTAHLVLDASASMDVWSGVTAAFARLVAGSGVFRTVRTLAVDHLAGEYRDGVRLTKTQMKPTEARLERSKTLPKYDITIRPKKTTGG